MENQIGFNPCFNGRGVKTELKRFLRSCFSVVSILVLMEEALRPVRHFRHLRSFLTSFNPCFNGRGVKTHGSLG